MNEAGATDAGLAALGAVIMLVWVANALLIIWNLFRGDHRSAHDRHDRGLGQSRKI